MTHEIIFYTNPMSRGRMVRWALEEIAEKTNVAYHTELLEYGTTMKAPEYLAINPMGKVPALSHRGEIVTETAAICAYLADAFPEAALAPLAGDPARGAYLRWMFFAAGPYESAMTNQMLGVVIPPEKKGFVGYGSYDEVMALLERTLTDRKYIAGDHFTMADIYVGSQIDFGLKFKALAPRPAFVAYTEHLKQRPAFIRAKAIDDALAGKN